MNFKSAMIRVYIKLKKIEAGKIFSDEEKQAMIPGMIEANRSMDKDITTCKRKLIKGLDIKEVKLENCGAWSVSRESNPKDKVIYYIHGGGFTGSCTKQRMSFVSYLVKKFGYNVFSIDYRLAPEFSQPAALLDCLDGYEYLLKSCDAKNIYLIGESAGGNLVIALSMLLRDRKLPLPCGVYANSAPTQFLCYTESFDKFSLKEDFIVVHGILDNIKGIYFEECDAADPYVSPLSGELGGLPPITLTASRCECLLDDSVHMYEKLVEAGNDTELITYDDLCHAFIISPQMPRVVKKAYPDLKRILKSSL